MLRSLLRALFLDGPRRMFLKELGVVINKLNEKGPDSPVWEGVSESIKEPNRTRR